ncbi:hypothetical protein [Kitasatospora sp. NPDC056731]|uniref:hypothetical protein n=1 Tax=Kitasatospora sp. NPDC056731 TaxID=3155422 RepID=UPI00342D9C5C
MTDQHNTAPAVWDPTARGGAGGWVRGPQRPAEPTPAQPAAGAVGDQGPPLGARPYLAAPQPPSVPPPAPFPSHASAQTPGPGYVSGEAPGPGYVYPPQPPAGPQQPPYVPYQGQPDYPSAYPSGYPADQPAGYEDLDGEDRPSNRKAPLLIGFALLLVVAVGGGLLVAARNSGDKKDQASPAPPSASATSTGNPPPGPAPTGTDAAPNGATDPASSAAAPSPTASGAGANAKTQAQALDGLLTEGESAKAPIGSAVAKVSSCPAKADIESAAQVFDNGAKQRDGLLRKLAGLSASDVPGGADAVASLKSAWQLSADIDRAYANWARTVAGQGCSGSAPNTADKKRADELNPQATQAKKDFAGKWKPIADTYGLTPRTQDRI